MTLLRSIYLAALLVLMAPGFVIGAILAFPIFGFRAAMNMAENHMLWLDEGIAARRKRREAKEP